MSRTGIHPSDEDACCTAGILLSGLRKHGDRGYQEIGTVGVRTLAFILQPLPLAVCVALGHRKPD